jgi:hypothetical protein
MKIEGEGMNKPLLREKMKVFIVSEVAAFDPDRVVAIFDSEQKAQHFVEDNTRDDNSGVSQSHYYYIDEWEVM